MRDGIRVKHYARNTEQAYIYWIRKCILFHDERHPKELGPSEVQAFLTHLALEEHISASTKLLFMACSYLWFHPYMSFIELRQILLKSCCLTKFI